MTVRSYTEILQQLSDVPPGWMPGLLHQLAVLACQHGTFKPGGLTMLAGIAERQTGYQAPHEIPTTHPIVIEMDGGLVTEVYTDLPADVVIADLDTDGAAVESDEAFCKYNDGHSDQYVWAKSWKPQELRKLSEGSLAALNHVGYNSIDDCVVKPQKAPQQDGANGNAAAD